MTQEKANEIYELWQAGDKTKAWEEAAKALEKLIYHNVWHILGYYDEDAVQTANMAIYKALEKFDPVNYAGYQVAFFLRHIRGAIMHYMSNTSNVSRCKYRECRQITRAGFDILEDKIEDIADGTGLTPIRVESARKAYMFRRPSHSQEAINFTVGSGDTAEEAIRQQREKEIKKMIKEVIFDKAKTGRSKRDPEICYKVFTMAHFHNMKPAKAAPILGIAKEEASSHYQYVLKILKDNEKFKKHLAELLKV